LEKKIAEQNCKCQAYLRHFWLKVCRKMSAIAESSMPAMGDEPDKKEVDFEAVLAFLRQRGLRETESLLQRELNVASFPPGDQTRPVEDPSAVARVDPVKPAVVVPAVGETGSEVTNVLTSYKSDGDPAIYGDAYQVTNASFHPLFMIF
jgi:hypothetical protein